MINLRTYIYLVVFSLLTFSCKASSQQDKKYPSLVTDLYEYHLNGPVKTMRCYMDFKEDELTKDQIKLNNAQGVLNITGSGNSFNEFNKKGLVARSYDLNDSINQIYYDTINVYKNHDVKSYIYMYLYKENDIKNKIKITQNFKPVKWVFNPYRVILDKDFYRTYDVIVKKDSSYKQQRDIYTYKTDNKGRIMNEIRDYQWDIDLDSKIDMTEHYYTVDYVYNDKDQLIKKVFKLQLKTYTDSYDLPDHDLTIEKTKETPIETYTYDDAGNLTSVYTYLNPEKTVLAYSEDYFYNDNNQLVRLLRRKATGMMGAFNRHFKRLNEFFFNDKGDVIQINSYENDEKTIHATYFYEYSGYDKYDNWTHMEMRIKDVPTKEPTMVADRIIEYYDDQKQEND